MFAGMVVVFRIKLWRCALSGVIGLVCAMGDASAHGTAEDNTASLDREIAARPDDPSPHIQRAMIELETGAWQSALADAELAVRKGARREGLDLLCAKALIVGGKFDAARRLLDEFIATHPLLAEPRLTRARLERRLRHPAEAVADFRTALSLTKTVEPDLFVELAVWLVNDGKTDDALALLDHGVKRTGAVASLEVKALEIEVSQGRHEAALRRIDILQDQAPRAEPWMARRAALLAQAGHEREAREAWLSLKTHIENLPDHERGSHAMSLIAVQVAQGLRQPLSRSISNAIPTTRP